MMVIRHLPIFYSQWKILYILNKMTKCDEFIKVEGLMSEGVRYFYEQNSVLL